jgi:hypothetical protein
MFLWPLALWLWATSRRRQALGSVGVALLLLGLSWAIVGFAGLADYPALVHRVSDYEASESLTLYGPALAAGIPDAVARSLWVVPGVAALVVSVLLGRRGDETGSFCAAVGAALLLAPIVWLHYLALLLVPLAVALPVFSWPWLLPLLLWVVPDVHDSAPWHAVLTVAVLVGVLACCLLRPARRSSRHRGEGVFSAVLSPRS